MEQVQEKTHALLGPSGAHRWAECPGSPVLEQPYPDSASIYAAWGTTAHEVADLCLQDGLLEEVYAEPKDAESFVGRKFEVDGFEIEVDMEMADCVNTYTSYVHSYVDLSAGDTLLVEQQVPLEHLTGEKDATGTSDVIGFAEKNTELVVIDLKGGQGVLVEAEDNLQLAMYALGSLEAHKGAHDFKKVRMVIIQTRKNHVSEWCLTVEQLLDIGRKVSQAAKDVRRAFEQKPELDADKWNEFFLYPGDKPCRFCKAKATCPALRGNIVDTITLKAEAFPDLDAEPEALPDALEAHAVPVDDLENAQLAAAMRAAPLIETWLKAVRAETERRLFDEVDVPGFGLFVGRQGPRRWDDESEAEAAMKASRIKQADMYDTKLISPTAAEKLLKDRPKIWKKMEEHITRSEGKPHVAALEDGGTPYTAHKAQAEDFPDLPQDEDPLLS